MKAFRLGVYILLLSCLCIVYPVHAETVPTDSDFVLNPDGSYSLSPDSLLFTMGEE